MTIGSTKSLQRWWEFIWAFTLKEVKARYKKAILGFLWIILNPVLQMLIIGFIFQFFLPVNVDNYFLFLFTGLLPWNYFSYSVTKNTPMILHERGLIKKAKFPREAIVISIVLSNLFHTLIGWMLLIILLVGDKLLIEQYSILAALEYTLRLFATIPLFIWLTILTIGFSFLFAALNVRFRDVNFLVQAIMPLWFYATPIVYTLNILPHSVNKMLYINPMTGLIELFHLVTLGHPVLDVKLIMMNALVSLGIFVLGYYIFTRESPYFDDYI